MNSKQLFDLVQSDSFLRTVVKGVYASNTLPEYAQQYPCAFIVNSQPLPMPGEHWNAIILYNPIHAEFFDSLGKNLSDYNSDIRDFISKNSVYCRYRAQRLQANNSTSCGIYVMFYIIARLCFKYGMTEVYNMFSNNLYNNDMIVRYFVSKYLCQ